MAEGSSQTGRANKSATFQPTKAKHRLTKGAKAQETQELPTAAESTESADGKGARGSLATPLNVQKGSVAMKTIKKSHKI